MSGVDQVLEKYDLRTLESAVRKRRSREQQRLSRLMEKRAKLEAELKKLGQEIREAAAVARAAGKIERKPNARRLNDISLADALEKVMKGRKTPIHYKALTDAVVERKLYRTKSRNLLSTVAVTLKRDKRFKKVEPGYYALKK
ncbi:winged helix-turn-helix domain-containing protein [bacterium]|nr:winged helix-turn-helix domain-containing protein [bacterium]